MKPLVTPATVMPAIAIAVIISTIVNPLGLADFSFILPPFFIEQTVWHEDGSHK